MADRAEVTKQTAYVVIGTEDAVTVPKAIAYFILEPGDEEPDTSNRQGHVYGRIVKNVD